MSARDQRLTKLVNLHLGFVESVLRNMGVHEAELDDAVQRTFMVVSDRLDRITVGAERSFLFTSAKHMACHFRRAAKRSRRMDPIDEELPSKAQSPEQLMSQKEARELLNQLLDELPEKLRVVFVLYEFEQLRSPEIAEMIGVPLGTVASRLKRARKHFRASVVRFQAAAEFKQTRIGSESNVDGMLPPTLAFA